ncbi:g10496 [Coccomyxa viridis]|uniref:G10496 protein n=1 Tax=Coccomyxa viridis TaxID=1274662 RepID=A0ABP1G5E3_9CHLO
MHHRASLSAVMCPNSRAASDLKTTRALIAVALLGFLVGNSAYSYSSNDTYYSLSADNNGQSYQESGPLPTPSSKPITAAPSSGPSTGALDESAAQPAPSDEYSTSVFSSAPSYGIVAASDISPDNLGAADTSINEPADTLIPDTPNPAGQADLVQEPTTVGEPVIINPSAGTGNADDDTSGR